MSLARKFVTLVLGSIVFIAITNILWFYIFYGTYLKVFISEKVKEKSKVSLEYVNSLIIKQEEELANNEIDDIFSKANMDFFELLDNYEWDIPLNKQKNVDIVIKYLHEKWVSQKYIEKIVPINKLEEVLNALKDDETPEYRFIKNIFLSIVLINIISIIIVLLFVTYFTQKILRPVRKATKQIKEFSPWRKFVKIKYRGKDEIGLLIGSINALNKRLFLQEWIRSKLLADISHELKTPITSIQCYLEWIIDWVIKLDEKNLESITSEMQRLIELVNRIMKYEQFENTDLSLKKEENNIYNILKSVVETHKNKLKENNQKIKISWDEDLKIPLDENSFIQLSHNLIWNFLKYSWKNTSMNINITKKYIDFLDNWKWIRSSEVPFLTEKFYQWDSSKSEKIDQRWIWIWLSIVWKIISSHNWDFKIKSDINKGFSFRIYF